MPQTLKDPKLSLLDTSGLGGSSGVYPKTSPVNTGPWRAQISQLQMRADPGPSPWGRSPREQQGLPSRGPELQASPSGSLRAGPAPGGHTRTALTMAAGVRAPQRPADKSTRLAEAASSPSNRWAVREKYRRSSRDSTRRHRPWQRRECVPSNTLRALAPLADSPHWST